MGKGDKKTKKGKTFAGSYGKTRKRKAATTFVAPKAKKAAPAKEVKEVEKPVAKKAPAKKPAAKKAPAKKTATKK
jgi:ribosomal small subunit protein bTHX